MRVAKFRVWDNENKEMIIKTDMHSNKLGIALMVSLEGNLEDVAQERFESHNMPLMEYTGLFDNQGVEICKGDIITDGGDYAKYEVKHGLYNIGCNGYEYDFVIYGFYVECENTYYHMVSGTCKVIGNILENPELLEKK